MTTKYRMYIDESGNPDLKSSDDPNHRFLSLTGVIISLAYADNVIRPAMDALKHRYFGKPVILHRTDIINHRGPFRVFIDSSLRFDFDHEILQYLSASDYTVITVCIDKKRHNEKAEQPPYEPYQYCLAVLIERFHHWLRERSAVGDLMIEARGTREDQKLAQMFRACRQSGVAGLSLRPRDLRRTFTSGELKIRPKSANDSGLQIADLLAHPSRNEILHEHNLLDRPLSGFTSKMIEVALIPKYYRKGETAVGYGKQLL